LTINTKPFGKFSRRAVTPMVLLATFSLVCASGIASWAIDQHVGQYTGIWISNALLVAVLMHHRQKDWAVITLVGFAANAIADTVGYGFAHASIYASINIIEVLALVIPLRYFRLDQDFTRSSALLAFYALAIGPTPMIGALISGAYFYFTQNKPFVDVAMSWYAADALGLVLIVPPLMTVRWQAMRAMFGRDQIVWTCIFLGVMLVAILINFLARNYPLAFLFFPAAMLLTFQRGFAGGTLGIYIAGAYLLIPALFGEAPGLLHRHFAHEQVAIVQIFIAVMEFSVVLVGAALEERRKLEQWLAAAISRAENSREEALVAKNAAEKANRSKSMFLANMSHELRTPLNAVIGFSEMMHTEIFGPLGDQRYREYTNLIRGAGQHLLDLINDILDMSKIEAGKHDLHCEKLNLTGLAAESLALIQDQATMGQVAIEIDSPSPPVFLTADRRSLKQILLNLLSNAVKFTPEGGKVTVRVRRTTDNITLAVADTGIGIPAEQIYRLGNPFIQIRNNAGTTQTGTGLGLALVRALTEMHNGTFRIESAEGEGTTVTLTFPERNKAVLAA
jgi:signal transduction histidine kinase